ncbi:THUMP domain-containing class I SAM-dependent RNA methyltransferase [Fervidobacterium thailandense]|uniref:RNA methyltransferase n=1 Tax=Fervidobacterium thailandense TaxID=1008305 RepID=A0A1E3G4L4_9BACT|nr:RNA methyltransferase [Fervidobacterium thailandense]ODN31122.1 RNA methyltransferase [Fervidobacterium thailandense]
MRTFVALCSAGLEGAIASELKSKNYKITYSSSGRVFFLADISDVPKLNLQLKTADRVTLLVSSAKVETFDDLFEAVRGADLRDLVERNARLVVKKVKVTNSRLSAKGAIASVVKKALVDNLGGTNETGATYEFIVILKDDQLFLLLDTSGESLSKRGYRLRSGAAPLRETIAASLIVLSRWRYYQLPLYDPFCGSGTIPIEAALIDVPNYRRAFASERWKCLSQIWKTEKKAAERLAIEVIRKVAKETRIHGSDVDCEVINVAVENARRAGVSVNFLCADFRGLPTVHEKVYVVSNLPYGQRLTDDVLSYIDVLRKKFPNGFFYLLHPSGDFENYFGKATKKFRFQNSGIWTYLYMYY